MSPSRQLYQAALLWKKPAGDQIKKGQVVAVLWRKRKEEGWQSGPWSRDTVVTMVRVSRYKGSQ